MVLHYLLDWTYISNKLQGSDEVAHHWAQVLSASKRLIFIFVLFQSVIS